MNCGTKKQRYTETEAETRKRNRMEAYFKKKKLGSGSVLEAYIYKNPHKSMIPLLLSFQSCSHRSIKGLCHPQHHYQLGSYF